ncbi:MAG: type IX secretion system sortase PorU, partial [Flavisolibacter sp.]|nr:type IX secretion system sortase PorU [Flavisolibacter sp.]
MRFSRGGLLLLTLISCFSLRSYSQRVYKPSSVLATGTWYKIAVSAEGVYKIDVQFLNSLGFGNSIPSNQIRLFGKNNGMLPEANDQPYDDDLQEIGIEVFDGGDGIVSGTDYILFFAAGPHKWIPDSVNKRFSHKKNLYSERQFFYISVGGDGKRIINQQLSVSSAVKVDAFDERYFHELDSVNFLQSGKEWYGEEFSNLPGRTTLKQFAVPASNVGLNAPITVGASFVSRSINNGSSFQVSLNGQNVLQVPVPAISSGLYESFAREASAFQTLINTQNSLNLSVSYTPGSFNAQGWLNWFEVFYRRQLLQPTGGQLFFRDWNSVGGGAVEFRIAGAATQVWEITDPLSPLKMNTRVNGTSIEFGNDASILREYVAIGNNFLIPQAIAKLANQNLHNTSETDYIIVTHPSFLTQAQRLASFHRQKNDLRAIVITTDQIYNEFSAGNPDPSAIRDFVKMYYDRYRDTWNDKGKYLLLFGRGSFDYKDRIPGNTNFVLAYESNTSLDPLGTYTSDDFFGFLDDHENINSSAIINELDIGIGRIPAKNTEEAKNFVDKIEAYHVPPSLGSWRNTINFIADDEDNNLHLQDAEVLSATTSQAAPDLNIYKIYLDAFRQESGLTGGRYPEANTAINNNIQSGTLIWNYSGHGGPVRLAEEVVLDQQIVNSWNNENKLPLFITATCDFAPFDQPLYSLGENLLIRPKTGAIALMTTTRIVFAYSNRIINNNYLHIALQKDSLGNYLTLGQAVRATKNYTYRTTGDVVNNRKFVLLGDPAMTLAFPKFNVIPTNINGNDINQVTDTLSATELIFIEGEVKDVNGSKLNDFNGTVYLSLFDKPRQTTTLGNDAGSLPVSFSTQTSVLFKGKVSANAGNFQFKFRLPKDINYQYGNGKMSFYAEDGTRDAGGISANFIIGGIGSGNNDDKEGPEIKAYLNDERFVNGSITNESPILIVKLSDSSGINTGNAGIDHDIIATLDGDNNKYYVLNDFYESELDNYQKGTVRFQLPPLSPGAHSLKIKVWDVMNNSNEYILDFIVANNDELVLDHVLNYPNPFTTKTTFWFEHNKPAVDLKTKIEVFTVTGRIIKTLTKTINTAGNRSSDIEWDGRDEYGMKIGNGVYLYRLTV